MKKIFGPDVDSKTRSFRNKERKEQIVFFTISKSSNLLQDIILSPSAIGYQLFNIRLFLLIAECL